MTPLTDSPEITQARATLAQATAALETVSAPILATIAQSRAALDSALAALDTAKDEHRPGITAARDALAALLRAEWRIAKPDEVKAMAILYGNPSTAPADFSASVPPQPGIEVVSHRAWLDGNPGDEIFRATCPDAASTVVYGATAADHARFAGAPFIHVRRELLERFRSAQADTQGAGAAPPPTQPAQSSST